MSELDGPRHRDGAGAPERELANFRNYCPGEYSFSILSDVSVPLTLPGQQNRPCAGPDPADPADINDFLDPGTARPRGKPDSGGPAMSLPELAGAGKSHGSGTSPEGPRLAGT